jgi:HSP20 family protein
MERLFDDTFRRSVPGMHRHPAFPGPTPASLRPSVDISEGKKAYTVRAELPGVDLEDVSIEVEGHTLLIRAEKRQETEEEEEGYHCVERSYGAMQRVLSLPDDADGEAIDARFKNGVLKLRIPKHAARSTNARSIEIQRG